MKKKLLVILLSCVAAVSLLFAAGCNGCEKKKSDGGAVIEIADLVTIEEFESKTLSTFVEGGAGKIYWSSSDESVVTVDETGTVYGVKVGEAKVTAAIGKAKGVCKVVVEKTSNAPRIEVNRDITVEIGDKYVGEAKTVWNGEEVADAEYEFIAEDAAQTVCSITKGERGKFTLDAKKEGSATFVAVTSLHGYTVSRKITVTVIGKKASVIPSGENLVATDKGYKTEVWTGEESGPTETVIKIDVYDGGTRVENADIAWDYNSEYCDYDPFVAKFEKVGNGEYRVRKVAPGYTDITGRYTSESGEITEIRIEMVVNKAQVIVKDYHPVIETQKPVALTFPASVKETIEDVSYDGISVLKSASGKSVELDGEAFPKTAAKLGEDKRFRVTTENYDYYFDADVYTYIIKTKADLDKFGATAKSCGDFTKTGALDGYFVLGADIDYDGIFTSITDTDEIYTVVNPKGGLWTDSSKYGFKGVFDGKGHVVKGMTIKAIFTNGSGGFVGCLNTVGIIKNVSFTDAGVYENNGFICSYGGGLIENVEIVFSKIGYGFPTRDLDKTSARKMGAFFSFNASATATVRNCVVDAARAEIAYKKGAVGNIALGTSGGKVENLIVVGGAEEYADCFGTGAYAFTYAELVKSGACRAAVSALGDEWASVNGIPFLKARLDTVGKDDPIAFVSDADEVYAGNRITLKLNNRYAYAESTELPDGATLAGDMLVLSESVKNGTATFKATSLLNGTTVTRTVTINAAKPADVTQTSRIILPAQNGAEIDLSFASSVLGDSVTLYIADEDGDVYLGNAPVLAGKVSVNASALKDKLGDRTLVAYTRKTGECKRITATVKTVTKVLTTADDVLDAFRNDVTGGYYLLGGDVDMSVKGNIASKDKTTEFNGTFDGDGYKIKNMLITDNVSSALVYTLGAKGVVKNVSFDGLKLGGLGGLFQSTRGRIENVEIRVADFGIRENGSFAWLWSGSYIIYHISEDAVIKNLKVDVSAIAGRLKTKEVTDNADYYALMEFDWMCDIDGFVISGLAKEWKNHAIRIRTYGGNKYNNGCDGKVAGVFVTYDDGGDNGAAFPVDGWSGDYWTVDSAAKTVVWKNKA